MSRIIVKNIPKNISEKDLKNHFSLKGDITDMKIMNNRFFAFIGFKSEEQALEAVKYFNNTFIWTSRITVEPAKVQGDPSLNKPWSKKAKVENEKENETEKNSKESKIKKLLELAKATSTKNKFDLAEMELHSKKNENNNENKEKGNIGISHDGNIDPKRLYLRNLPFVVTDEDLKSAFENFGQINEVFIPRNHNGNNAGFGYAYITFETIESAIMALSEMDKKIFQGRILHITPAQYKKSEVVKKVPNPYLKENKTTNKSEFKKKKNLKNKLNFDDETNWNYLFMNQNAVVTNISNKLNIDKSQLLDRDTSNLAVNVAAMETHIINETKEWLTENGMNLDVLKGKRSDCVRSKSTILIKNISPSLNKDNLEGLFARYGVLTKFIIAPSNCFAVAEFIDENHAKNCIKNLSYHEVDGLPLYLEFAPEGLVKKEDQKVNNKTNKSEEAKTNLNINDNTIDLTGNEGKILFIMNLNFKTKEEDLISFFKKNNFQPLKVKIVTHKKNGNIMSSGYGFAEFKSTEQCQNCIKKLQGQIIDDHSIKLSIAKSKENKSLLGNKRKKETDFNDVDFISENVEDTKILVKNIAFEATKDEIRKLFKGYGELKNVRLPTKLDGQHRGFCFIEFVTHDEAKNAFKKLQNTHFYGRKLVFEWAKKETTIEDLRESTKRKLDVRSISTNQTLKKSTFETKKRLK